MSYSIVDRHRGVALRLAVILFAMTMLLPAQGLAGEAGNTDPEGAGFSRARLARITD